MEITTEYLLRGAFLSAAQGWHLLHDARLLYSHDRFSSSLVLGVYCIEEVGRSRALLDLTRKSIDGISINREEVCSISNHFLKLRKGDSSPKLKFSWDMLDEAKERELARDVQTAQKSGPKEMHQARMNALYVNPDGSDWNVPSHLDPSEALLILGNAAAEYSLQRNNLSKIVEESPHCREISAKVALPQLPDPAAA